MMRRIAGCLLLLASVVTIFVTVATALVGRALAGGAPLNLPLIGAILLAAFLVYCAGMALLTSIRG
ncbi:MAG TPA: hypothetical protein VKQ30_07975 [Ktedonobacterales bacterium]|nr:hypothetical protein [Ktedonobacterales bacterium]